MSIFSRERRHLGALLFVAATLRLYALGEESLWLDELLTLMFIERWSGLELAVQLPQAQPHLPVYYLLLDAWISLVGTSEFALRFPSAMFGVAAVVVMYAVGRKAGGHGVGMVAGLLLAVSQFHIRYSQETRMYSLLTFLVLLSVYLLLRFRATPTRRTAASYGVVTAVLLYTHVFAVFVILAEVVWVLFCVLGSDRPLAVGQRWLGAFAPVGLAALPAVLAVVLRTQGGVSYPFIPRPSLYDVLSTVPIYFGYRDNWLLPFYLLGISVVGGLVVLAVTGDGRVRPSLGSLRTRLHALPMPPDPSDPRTLFVLLFVAALGLPVAVSYLITPVFWPRYTIAAMVPLFLLVALGTDRLDPPPVRYAVAALVIVSMLPTLGTYYGETQKEEWDEAGSYVEGNAKTGDLVLVADQIALYGAEHYVERSDIRTRGIVTNDSNTGYASDSNETIAAVVNGEPRVWLMFWLISDSESARIRAIVAANRSLAVDREYHGVRLLLYIDESDGSP